MYLTGWTGRNCDHDIDECNRKTFCGRGNCTDTVGSFYCTCPPSVYGLMCQLDEDECMLHPCNGGECFNKVGSYECRCINGILGENCETFNGSTCDGVSCSKHGNCYISNGKPMCHCNPGYSGTDCSVRNVCFQNECKHNSTCVIY